jgi:hypothetical protein
MNPVCADCGITLVEQRMPTQLRWNGKTGNAFGWIPENEETFWVHPFGKDCKA